MAERQGPGRPRYGQSVGVQDSVDWSHRRRPLTGRDPAESHRASTPLELLYDLTIVVAIGTAANELAGYVAAGHVAAGIGGFVFATIAVVWAWINYSWFASAYDTDDWVFRLATMVQMVGVIVLALGLQQAFASIERGSTLRNGVMVAGYVVMRASMLFLWAQVARHDEKQATAARTYLRTIAIAQTGWVTLVFVGLPIAPTFVIATGLMAIELAGPALAERRGGTPWHLEHIVERYGLLVIITLGEGIIGTVAALNALVHSSSGWTVNAALVAIAGVGLTFASWWLYFAAPWPELVRLRRARPLLWGYGHIAIFASLAATGAGLRVASSFLDHRAMIGPVATVLSVSIPVAVYIGSTSLLYSALLDAADRFQAKLVAETAGVLALAVGLAAAGVEMPVCLIVVMLAPVVNVIGFERVGHRSLAGALARADAAESEPAA